MRVAFVVSGMMGGGTERVVAHLTQAWSQRGHDTHVVTLSSEQHGEYILQNSVRRWALNVQGESGNVIAAVTANIRRMREIRKVAKQIEPDVIFSFITATNVLVLMGCAGLPSAIVVSERSSIRDDPPRGIWKLLLGYAYGRADAVVAQTAEMSIELTEIFGRQVEVAWNPLSHELSEQHDDAVLNVQEIASRSRIVLAAGRLDYGKGFDLLISAFKMLADDFPDWSLVILGEGELKTELMAQVRNLELENRVYFPGFTTAPRSAMSSSDVFVLSSRFEGLPNVLMEALAGGLACISADCGAGVRELVKDGENGVLFESGNVVALKEALKYTLQSGSYRKKMGLAAQQSMERFSLDAVYGQWLRIATRVLHSRSSRRGWHQ